MVTTSKGVKYFWLIVLLAVGCTTSGKKENEIAEHEIVVLNPQSFKEKLEATPDAVLIDVRTPEELSGGIIEGAINIDVKDSLFMEKIHKLDQAKPYFVYCLSGKRSNTAVQKMEEAGFKDLYTLQGGFGKWVEEGLPTTTP